MRDLPQKIERSHEIRNGELIVIRTQKTINSADREVTVITEEKGITQDIVDEVLSKAIPREVEKIDREISRLQQNIESIKQEVAKFEEDPEFVKFYEFNERKDTELYFELMKLSDEAQEKVHLTRDRDFQNFKKYVSRPEVQQLSKNLKKMTEMAQKQAQLDEAMSTKDDIMAWKKQFEDINEAIKPIKE